ncbi:MAG: hypothetical protein JW757_03090 [Anaerolineales bacterium]|nr:hypothetical protein [Anaerolineales bacterium]
MTEYMKILKMIETGEITPDEGAELLKNLEHPPEAEPESGETIQADVLDRLDKGEINADQAIQLLNTSTHRSGVESEIRKEENFSSPPTISDEELRKWKQWWTLPLYIGVAIVALSSLWINTSYQNSGYGFWFFCAWIPLLIGVLFIMLSLGSRSGPWIHVRVKSPTERVAISIPAPLKLTGWVLNTFGHYIPHMDHTSVDEILSALEQTTKQGAPLYVNVDEGEDGEKVEVFIG